MTTTMIDTYPGEALSIVDGFRFELCSECTRDLDEHLIGPDMFGHAHAWCLVGEHE